MGRAWWPRNRGLLHPSKHADHAQRHGHRVIYVPGFACPSAACPSRNGQCGSCGALSNSFAMAYDEPRIVEHEHALVRASPNPVYAERLEHRWLTAPPVVTAGGATFALGVDFDLEGRDLVWRPGRGPGAEADYTVSYSAYHEDPVMLIHAVMYSVGGRSLAEQSRSMSWGEVDQGQIVASIPFGASCYNIQQGDLFVAADGTMRTRQKLDLTLPARRAQHRFVVDVVRATYHERSGGSLRTVDVAVSYDFVAQEWLLPELPPEVETLAITYDFAPTYQVYLDSGEFRTPVQGPQPRLVLLIRSEVTL